MNSAFHNFKNSLPTGVELLAVSKGQQISSIRKLIKLGQLDFGESRLQEALPKINELNSVEGLRWHFIGRLQSNKVRSIVKNFHVIHSVDSLLLAERIARISEEENKRPKLMLQVKLRHDPNKGGFLPEDLLQAWPKLIILPNIDCTGLMTMAPIDLDEDDRKKMFKECRVLADKLLLKDCSMGMTRDWQDAVEAGATWLRLGKFTFTISP